MTRLSQKKRYQDTDTPTISAEEGTGKPSDETKQQQTHAWAETKQQKRLDQACRLIPSSSFIEPDQHIRHRELLIIKDTTVSFFPHLPPKQEQQTQLLLSFRFRMR
jgi:hypothetical protein